MTKKVFLIITAFAVTLVSMPIATAFAKQQCSASPNPRGYWSWRLIDGRKCWYEGKPMLSKSSLEWPSQVIDYPSGSNEEPAIVPTQKPSDPLNAQAKELDSESFEALWNARIVHH
jgi:hypothetical protein